jgi:hypothetical protein
MNRTSADIQEFYSFCRAKDLGIVFSPKDLTTEQLNKFSIIKEKLDELEERKNGR